MFYLLLHSHTATTTKITVIIETHNSNYNCGEVVARVLTRFRMDAPHYVILNHGNVIKPKQPFHQHSHTVTITKNMLIRLSLLPRENSLLVLISMRAVNGTAKHFSMCQICPSFHLQLLVSCYYLSTFY